MSSTDLDVFLNETSFYIFLVFRHLRHIYVFIIAFHQQELLVCFIPILGFQLEDFLNLFLIDLLSHPIFDKICTVNLRFQLREVRAEADDPVIARLLDGVHSILKTLQLVITEHLNEGFSTIPIDLACMCDVVFHFGKLLLVEVDQTIERAFTDVKGT